MTDHAERLRNAAHRIHHVVYKTTHGPVLVELLTEAADELDRLKGENAKLNTAFNLVQQDCQNLTEKVIPNLTDEIATLKSTLAGVRALPGEWLERIAPRRPSAAGMEVQVCADELQAKLVQS